jgi:hypothetical protein
MFANVWGEVNEMITHRGSQSRESYQDAGYRIVATWPEVDRGHVVLMDETGKRELWVRRPDYAGYVVTINGIGYEFVRSL